MNCLKKINLKRITENDFLVLIEISKGSNKKFELDKETGLLSLDRILNTSFVYPANYGFIPLTHSDDNDPLDVFVLSQEVLEPMVLVRCRPIGVIKMMDDGELDEKILAVPIKDSFMMECQDIKHISNSILKQIEHFLIHYKDLEQKKVVIEGIYGKFQSLSVIRKCLDKYQQIQK
ncbi:inorganic diphosphatase [Candidatus Phytoplasma fraxini]|uniref:Inorganic pyrophosphatase n=1 Tax=Ash yellows phytoplasma TaxID=35780 RepID=A0ABZ2U9J6_ASHYP